MPEETHVDDLYITAPDHLLLFDEAVSRGIPRRCLIEAAVKEEIELLFEVPAPSVTAVLLPHQGLNSPGTPDNLRIPEYLVLEPRYCQALQQKSGVLVQESKRGYRRNSKGKPLHRLDPGDADKEPNRPVSVHGVKSSPPPGARRDRWRCWALQLNGAPFDHQVNRENLRVLALEVHRWLGWTMKSEPRRSFVPNARPKEKDKEDFLSQQLQRMCEAADVFWGARKLNQSDPDTYPRQEDLVEWLMRAQVGFTPTAAKNAASLITPEWATTVGRPSKKRG